MPRKKKVTIQAVLTRPEIPDKDFWEQDRQKFVRSFLRQQNPWLFRISMVLCILCSVLAFFGLTLVLVK